MSGERIELHFDVDQPIELVELTLAFQAVARDYKRFIGEQARISGGKVDDDAVKLYITKIETNCILAELAAALPFMGGFITAMDYQNTFIDYVKNFAAGAKFLIGLAQAKTVNADDVKLNRHILQGMADIFKIAMKNTDGKFRMSVKAGADTPEHGKVYYEAQFDSTEAAQIERGALLGIKALDAKNDAPIKNVVMYLHRTSQDDAKGRGRTDDQGVIADVSDKPIPVHFASDIDQAQINAFKSDPKHNPFKASYRVDVSIQKNRHQKPLFYRVINLHEIIPDEDGETA